MATLPLTARIINENPEAVRRAEQGMEGTARGAVRLTISDERPENTEVIYIYNVLRGFVGANMNDNAHIINQAPCFPALAIPACPKSQRFSVTVIPRYVKVRYEKPGTTDAEFKVEDGRRHAGQLMNPASYPSVEWNNQLQNWRSRDQTGNNLNLFGCFWSLEPPRLDESKYPDLVPTLEQSPALEKQLKMFETKARQTMEALIRIAESAHAAGKPQDITPMQHFAMDYLGKQATWHMNHDMMIVCPTCGEMVKEGIAYHKNSMGEKCPVDYAKCRELGIIGENKPAVQTLERPEPDPGAGLSDEEAEIARAAAARAKGGTKKNQSAKPAGAPVTRRRPPQAG